MLNWGCKSMRERNQMSQVKITWKAFGDKPEIGRFISSVEFETTLDIQVPERLCESIYHATNTYSGALWDVLEPKLSATRTHTSISIGDEIEIDGQVYICADLGFEKIEDVEIKYFGDSVFRVSKKVSA
jgi:hypothetical protein